MELVYLWVEEYKNIYHQGFNFSPRFECEYDEESEKLTIKDKSKDYTSIFPDNINITAIVGENGSGKSNILDMLSIGASLVSNENLSNRDIKEKMGNSFFIFYRDDIFVKSFGNDCEVILNVRNSRYDSYIIREQFTLSYNFMLENRQEYYYNSFDISNKLFVQPSKSDNILNFELLDKESNKFLLFNILEFNEKIKIIDDFFIPNYFRLEIDRKFYLNLREQNEELFAKLFKFQNKVSTKQNSILSLDDIKLINSIFYVLDIDEQRKYPARNQYKLNKRYNDILEQNNFEEKVDFILNNNYDDIFDNNIPFIKHNFKFIKFLEDNKINNINNGKYTFSDNMKLLKVLPNWIDISLYNEKNISFNTLSNGEKFLIRLMYNLIFYLNKIKKENSEFINILFDEVDIGLHPQWQKKFLNLIVNLLKKHSIKSNIIITSHSPFILSDLPKENVIFLDNGEQKDPFKDKQTFGANIHTLLSDGFFMSDGLMGEFAKGKIEEIKKFYDFVQKFKTRINSNKKIKERIKQYYLNRKERFNHIKSIIGEPFLQTVIKNYLDELELEFLDKDSIDLELEKLEKRKVHLEKLKNAKN